MTPITLAENVRAYLEEQRRDLRAHTPQLRIYGALDLALPSVKLPGLATVPLGEDTDPDLAPEGTETVQRVFTTIAVVAAIAAPNDPSGDRARDPLDTLVTATRERLAGWVPARRWDPLALRRSRLLLLADGRVAWQDEYTTYGWRVASRS
ncbi:MAG: hypothetical protein F4Y57_13775 [Acidobacteria bacterium]|nr:hypothetical protein [Acidobacteriota bacterium]